MSTENTQEGRFGHNSNKRMKNIFERVMPHKTITGQETDKPQFPSRTDGMDRAIVRKTKQFFGR